MISEPYALQFKAMGIEFVSRNAFAIRSPDSNTDYGWYKAGATPAVPEAAT